MLFEISNQRDCLYLYKYMLGLEKRPSLLNYFKKVRWFLYNDHIYTYKDKPLNTWSKNDLQNKRTIY